MSENDNHEMKPPESLPEQTPPQKSQASPPASLDRRQKAADETEVKSEQSIENEHPASEVAPSDNRPSTPPQETEADRSVGNGRNGAEESESTAVGPAEPSRIEKPGVEADVLLDPAIEAQLEQEVEEALGEMSVFDMYSLGETASTDKDASAETGRSSRPSVDRHAHGDNQGEGDQFSDAWLESPAPGISRGKIIDISNDGIFVDLGGKSQGFLPTEELDEDEKIEVGADIDVAILRYDARDGLLILSRKSAEQQLLRRNLREGVHVEARVVGWNKGGLELDIKGLKAFMPASQIDIGRIEDFEPLVNQRFVCEVIQVDRGDKNIVLSRRKVLEQEAEERSVHLWDELEVGQLRHGIVRTLMEYGAFVDLGGMDGLLHVSEMSWARIKHPKEILSVGQAIDVVVIEKDDEKRRLSLSLRQAGGDPWTMVDQNYPVGSRHQAQITNLMNFGAFAQLEPGVEGLIPISEMTWAGRIRHPSDVVQPGMMVEVDVLKVDAQKRRISLSMKSLQENPWADVTSRYVTNNVYTGKVARLTEFGAFVTLEPGVDGLVHISEVSEKRINKVSDVLSMDQEVQVRVLSVDPDQQRIALSLKGISTSEEETKSEEEPDPSKKKRQRPLRGGLTW